MALDILLHPYVTPAREQEMPPGATSSGGPEGERADTGPRRISRSAIGIAAAAIMASGVGSLAMHAGMDHSMTGMLTRTSEQAAAMNPRTGTAAPAVAVTLPAPGPDAGPMRAGGPGRAVSIAPPAPVTTSSAGSTSSSTSTPASPSTATSAPSSTTSSSAARTASSARYATVRDGDSFGSIAARTGVTPERIAALNPGVDSSALTVGEALRVA